MTFSFEQLNIAHDLMRTCEESIMEQTGMKIRLAMRSISVENKRPYDMLPVIAAVLGMCMDDYQNPSRKQQYVELRFLTSLFLKQYWPRLSLSEIGVFYGGMDHSTILKSIGKSNSMLQAGDLQFTHKYNIVKTAVEAWLMQDKTYEVTEN